MDAAPRKTGRARAGRQRRRGHVRRTGPDLDFAAQRIATFGNYQAGQSCIAVQRVIVERAVADTFVPKLLEPSRAAHRGPARPRVEVGPLVDEAAAERVEEWVNEAVAAGAKLLAGGKRDGASVEPDRAGGRAVRRRRSGPRRSSGRCSSVSVTDGVDEAFAQVNDSKYGLQAGVFTRDVQVAFRAPAELEVGGVIVGDVPSFRADQMPTAA